MTTTLTTAAFAATRETDTFKTKEGKAVTITAIKHASLRIQYDGLEIQVDPVAQFAPETDYSKFPKADIILVTHEHFDHFDRGAIATLKKGGTQVIANPAVQRMLGSGTALANGDQRTLVKDINLAAVPAYNTTPGHTPCGRAWAQSADSSRASPCSVSPPRRCESRPPHSSWQGSLDSSLPQNEVES